MQNDPARRARKPQNRFGRLLAAALAATALLGLGAPQAQAMTGGASPIALSPSPSLPEGFAFSPLRVAGATWYGPGLYGNSTACGQVLRPRTIGVAHRSLPCGTTVRFIYKGRSLITRVIDRGPYTRGNAWDLTNGAREILGFEGVDKIRYAVATRLARE